MSKKLKKSKRSKSVPQADLLTSEEIDQYVDFLLPGMKSCAQSTQETQTDLGMAEFSQILKDSQEKRGFLLTQESKLTLKLLFNFILN